MIIESMNDRILQEDLEIIASKGLPSEELRGASVLVTGATGLVGSQLVKALACINRVHSAGMTVLAMVRSTEKAERIFGKLLDRDDVKLVIGDVTTPYTEYISNDTAVDYVIHTASVTTSKIMVTKPVETINTAMSGTNNILDLARAKGAKSVIYVSSMEVYGSFTAENGESPYIREDDLGYIDPLKVRSNYPESKRMCENMCIAYSSEYGLPVKIARLSQTFGAGILPGENRVFAQFAKSAVKGEDIVLHTKGLSDGNYCYTRDTVEAMLLLLVKGKNGEAYNIANENNHTTIAAMAEMVAEKIGGGRIKVVFDIPKENLFGYAADTKMKLCSEKIQSLGWKPSVDLEEAYTRMIGSMKEIGELSV